MSVKEPYCNNCDRMIAMRSQLMLKKVREKSRECHNHKPQPLPDTKRKGKPTNPNKHKSNKRKKSTNARTKPRSTGEKENK